MTENVEKAIVAIISEVSGFDEEEIKPDSNFLMTWRLIPSRPLRSLLRLKRNSRYR